VRSEQPTAPASSDQGASRSRSSGRSAPDSPPSESSGARRRASPR
jgi:hypothetical protein